MAYKYVQMRDLILEDALKHGNERLPSEQAICKRYGVSRTTAIKALNSLADENLVRREVGRGTFINADKVKVRVNFLVGEGMQGFATFAQEVCYLFGKSKRYIDVRVHQVDSKDLVSAIVRTPGLKVLCMTHVGFLSGLNLLYRLDRLSSFRDTCSRINSEYIDWRRDWRGEMACHSLPLFLSPDIVAFNRTYASRLGLDAENGPRSCAEFEEWAMAAKRIRRRRKGSVMGCHIKPHQVLPLSFYNSMAHGRPILQDAAGGIQFNFNSGEQWLSFFQRLRQSGAMLPCPVAKPDPILFGDSLLSPTAGAWVFNQVQTHKCRYEIGLCPPPPVEPDGVSFANIGKCELAIVHEGQENEDELDAAWTFVKFLLTRPAAQRLLIRDFSCISANREVYAEQQADPKWLPFVRALATGRVRNDHPIQHGIMKTVSKYFYSSVLDGAPCSEAAEKIDSFCRMQLELMAVG